MEISDNPTRHNAAENHPIPTDGNGARNVPPAAESHVSPSSHKPAAEDSAAACSDSAAFDTLRPAQTAEDPTAASPASADSCDAAPTHVKHMSATVREAAPAHGERVSATTRTASDAEPADKPVQYVTTPAWEGCDACDVSLVLEGGGMRGQFTGGVLDFFMEKHLFCKQVIGVSAGALMGYYYATGLYGQSCYQNIKYCTDWRYLSLRSYVVTGNACGREFFFHEVPEKLDPIDFSFYDRSPIRLTSVSSDLETGEALYHTHRTSHEVDYLIASSSMPLVSQIVELDGHKLLDGGTCDSVPIVHSLLTGMKKHIVVTTHERGFVRKPNRMMALMHQRYADYPYFVERAAMRHYDYNRTYRALARMHDAGEAFVIWPPEPVTVSDVEHDPQKLLDLYAQGYETAARAWPALMRYLEA